MDDELVTAGRDSPIPTYGRRSGEPREVTVGFVETTDGDILVAARQGAAWAENLFDDPRCRVTIGARTWDALAEPLAGVDYARVVRESILRYGTPAETLGSGP